MEGANESVWYANPATENASGGVVDDVSLGRNRVRLRVRVRGVRFRVRVRVSGGERYE